MNAPSGNKIVHVLNPNRNGTTAAELVDGHVKGRPSVVKVIYLESRTGAYVARTRLRKFAS